ncbi:dihydrofolate reductase family protein [Shewanella algae]|uniref:Dihydrofolate reductase n=1 Tax=Shewanella algae TaxID=38313 RepID=A0A7T8EAP9_9GAMM|nr:MULTISPECIES: dihydrofolate reductase family protein [Shewanella]MBO2611191.1 dihydrofolate reductase [Shewanella algae]MBO2644703.1 dihydrofolate reductase [Shewanella algae]MBO2695503.1 dihydrofolate reductase [Shewanella algae]MCM2530244.1 dihydrofolate reductase family protein [Shewanella algae]MDL2195823.1 dihydrofolate reductase family protein [Shewanella algae]
MKNRVYMAQSLDGFIAGPNGELDWLAAIDNPEGSDLGFAEFMASVDALLMGRNTFEVVAAFDAWPYDKPVFVASNSLKQLPEGFAGKAELICGSATEMLSALHAKGYYNIYLDGGALIRSFIAAALVDELTITTVPVLLGGGIRLFDTLPGSVNLKLVSSQLLLGQLVKNRYQFQRETQA